MITYDFEAQWSEYQPIVAGLAYQYGRRHNQQGASAEDFSQEAVLWMLDNEKKLSDKREEIDSDEEFGRWLARSVENEFKDYAVDIRDAAGGQPRRGAYWYSTNELKALLPNVFDRSKWLHPPQAEGGSSRGKGVPSEGNNWVTTLADVARGFQRLSPEDQVLLRRLHQDGARNKDLAASEDISEASMSSKHTQALKRLQTHLGGAKPRKMRPDDSHDPFRGRHAVSNATARAMTSHDYEDENG